MSTHFLFLSRGVSDLSLVSKSFTQRVKRLTSFNLFSVIIFCIVVNMYLSHRLC